MTNAERWANDLLVKKDYRGLAAIHNSTNYDEAFQLWDKRVCANSILIQAGAEAVDNIIKELELEDVGSPGLADLLVIISDTRAVPLLKKLLNRGVFDAYGGTKSSVNGFIDRYPELFGEIEKFTCPICQAIRPATDMKGFRDMFFCEGDCWSKRGRMIEAGYGKDCPNYHEGVCIIRGRDTGLCSLGPGRYYATDCFAYRT